MSVPRSKEYKAKQKLWWMNEYRTNPEFKRRHLESCRERYRKNPMPKRETALMIRYGLTMAKYAGILESQQGICLLCQKPPREGRFLVVHHDHGTNRVVGLLHQNCNVLLGIVGDSPRALHEAALRISAAEESSIQIVYERA